jgi:hypothetical protein
LVAEWEEASGVAWAAVLLALTPAWAEELLSGSLRAWALEWEEVSAAG